MLDAVSPKTRTKLGPHSRALARGVIGDAIDGRSAEGRFLRACEAELTAHVGGEPSFTQKLLIRRAARAMLKLEMLDAKIASGIWTDFDARTFGGLSSSLRLALRELGLRKEAATPRNPLAAHFARPHGAAP